MASGGAVETDFRQMLIVMGVIAVFLLSLILLWDWEDEANRKRLALQQTFEVTNTTDETVSVWVRRGTDPPVLGSPISIFRSADCGPPECGLARGVARSWTIDRRSDSDYPPFLVAAWSDETERILYSVEFTMAEMEASGWQVAITDQR